LKLGRFIVDTHVHSQRHAAGSNMKGSTAYADLGRAMMKIEAYDNSPRLLYDMETYGVDMCLVEPAFSMTNETNVAQMKAHPDKIACLAEAKTTGDKALAGEIEWTMDAACEELDALLKTGNYVGIGEGMPYNPTFTQPGNKNYQDELSVVRDMFKVMDLARYYKIPVRFHCGLVVGYAMAYHGIASNYNPWWAHDLAINYPDVPIIMEHGGIEGWWWEHLMERCLHVAASHNNVYLETGRYWTEAYYKALSDPNIGAARLIWGTDWGASLPIFWRPGGYPTTHTEQLKTGIVRHQVDVWGWSLKQLQRLDIPQDDLNLILGGNAVRIYKLRKPGGLTRMFSIE
jgi:predicted TIM-barrel fold metal-dependent hydrolase